MEGRHSASPEQRAGFFTAQYNKGNDAFGGRGQAGPTAGCKKFWFPEVGDSPLQTVSIIINICVYYFEKQEERRLMAEEGMEVGIAEGSLMRLLPAPPTCVPWRRQWGAPGTPRRPRAVVSPPDLHRSEAARQREAGSTPTFWAHQSRAQARAPRLLSLGHACSWQIRLWPH